MLKWKETGKKKEEYESLMTHSLEIARHPASIGWLHFRKRQVSVPSTYALVDWQLVTNVLLLVTNIAWKAYVEKRPFAKTRRCYWAAKQEVFVLWRWALIAQADTFSTSLAPPASDSCEKKSGVLPKKKLNEADFQSEVFFFLSRLIFLSYFAIVSDNSWCGVLKILEDSTIACRRISPARL